VCELQPEFAQNHRGSYVSPIRFYLFASVLFFFVLAQATDVPEIIQETIDPITQSQTASEDSLEYLDSRLTEDQVARTRRLVARGDGFAREAIISMANDTYEAYQAGTRPGLIETCLLRQFIEVFDDPQNFLERSLDNAPFTMFFLLPFYAFSLKIIYIRSGKYIVEHLVFALYLHSFAFLLLTVQILAPLEEAIGIIRGALVFVFFGYYFLALRRFYGQGSVKSILKYAFLLLTYALLMGPSLLGTFVLAATQLFWRRRNCRTLGQGTAWVIY